MTWPGHWEADVATADGGTVHVRPITPADADRLVAFHARQSPESIYFRFFTARPRLSAAEVRHFTHVDLRDRVAFVAILGDDLVGVGRYDRYQAPDEAEVAFFIDDEHHGRGLATILLEYLAAAGRDNGIRAFTATVLPSNRGMLSVFTQAGFEASSSFADGVIDVRFEIAPTPASQAAMEERASRADARTVARILEPRSVAVIGAGRRAGTIGHEVLRQLVAHGFGGSLHAVNPEAEEIAGVKAWPSVLDVPERLDLAVVAVPAAEVRAAVEACGRAGVGALVVISTGLDDQAGELVAAARRHGIRLLGPGSFGVINTDPDVRLHATFAPVGAQSGAVAMSLQSGTLAAGLLRRMGEVGLGCSAVVAVGDKLDVSGNDLLAWWEHDERTDVVVLSLASYGNPRRFRVIAPRVSRRKPIVAQVRVSDPVLEGLLQQTGVVGVDGFDAMVDVACVLAWQPVPAGARVAVVADSAGSAAYATAALQAEGMEVVAEAVLGPDADPSGYETAVAGADADAVLVVYAAALLPQPEEVGRAVAAGSAARPELTVVACFPGHELRQPSERRLPELGFPDRAAKALGAAVRYGRWRARPEGVLPELDRFDLAAVDVAADGYAVLRAIGATVAPMGLAVDAGGAAAVAAALAVPVALKAIGRRPGAKIEASGVALDLHEPEDVARSFERMAASLGPAMDGAVVQAMVPPGVDVRISLEPAAIVGAAVGVGIGGAFEQPQPRSWAVLPLTDVGAHDVVDRSGIGAQLDDAGRAALVDLLLRVGRLADERPVVSVIDLNPVIVAGGVAHVTDVVLERTDHPDEPPDDLRRLG